MNPPKFWILKG